MDHRLFISKKIFKVNIIHLCLAKKIVDEQFQEFQSRDFMHVQVNQFGREFCQSTNKS